MADDLSLEIHDAADIVEHIHKAAEGLDVTITVTGDKVIVMGPDLHQFMILVDPSYWAPKDIPEA